jgi:CRP-like cAMP-binding protein
VAILEQLGFLASASHNVLERLAGLATEEQASAGTSIVREGDPADALYVLVDGEVEVTARGEAGEEQTIRRMSAPCYFGEIGVLERIPRTATVTALTDARLLRIEGTALLDALTTAPPSSSLMENARSRLALTHPSRDLTYSAADKREPV